MEEVKTQTGASVEVQDAGTVVPNSEVVPNAGNGQDAGTVAIDVAALQLEKQKKLAEFMAANGITKDDAREALQIKVPDKAKRPLKYMPSLYDLEYLYNCKDKGIGIGTAIETLNTKRRTFYKEYKGVIHTLEFISKDNWLVDGKKTCTSSSAAAVELVGAGKSVSGPVWWCMYDTDVDD